MLRLNLSTDIESCSERKERRVRLLNLVSWSCAFVAMCWALAQFVDPTPGMWRPALVNTVGAIVFAAIAATRGFDEIGRPFAFVASFLIYITCLTVLLGTNSGLLLSYLGTAAGSAVVVDPRRLHLAIAVAAIAAALLITVRYSVPADPGLTPSYLQVPYFVSSVIGTFTVTMALVIYAVRLADQAERSAEQERARSDELLLNILPASVAARLKHNSGEIVADSYAEASVLLADMAGFTARAGEVTAVELVQFLNSFYRTLDELVDKHGLEKIKTSGDAYMVVSGVPDERPDHAERLADLALAMQARLEGFVDTRGESVPVRIGIASGPVVAGVVGTRRFFYDVWGDAVNMASRMESTGEPGKIHIAPSTRDLLGDRFLFVERDPIEVRGKGPMRNWFLIGRRGTAVEGLEVRGFKQLG